MSSTRHQHEGLLKRTPDGRWVIDEIGIACGDTFEILTCPQCNTWLEVRMGHNGTNYYTIVTLHERMEVRIK